MTEDKPVPTPDVSGGFPWLMAEWANRLAQAIEGMGGKLPGVEVAETGDQPSGDGSFWWAQELSLIPGHSIWVGAPESSWREIGAGALQAIGIETPEPGDIRDTYREILAQSLSGLAAGLTVRCHKEVTCQAGEPLAGPPDTGTRGFISLRRADDLPVPLCFVVRLELLQKLDREILAQMGSDQAGGKETGRREHAEPAAVTIEPLLDLEMPVSVSLGIGRLNLEDAFKLTRGSLIPLSRRNDNLVEFRVNGRVVAFGEIVAVGGQYGIRVQDLISRGERLYQLGTLNRAGQPDTTVS
ncbi:MAG: FliM/FliN family flagellar motor switch protein [Bryobacteraceae bacterium]|jgi:flagellar motor switch protein FliN/FliY